MVGNLLPSSNKSKWKLKAKIRQCKAVISEPGDRLVGSLNENELQINKY